MPDHIYSGEDFDQNFESRTAITEFSQKVIEHLQANARDIKRNSVWTKSNFKALTSIFPKDKTSCFHRRTKGRKRGHEFLWDFIAQRKSEGFLYLVAESEANTVGAEAIRKLKHDFEKLLYVFAPVRVMICKSKDEKCARRIADHIQAYGRRHCVNLSPGSVIILHCCLANERGSVSFWFQSKQNPIKALERELMSFDNQITHLKT